MELSQLIFDQVTNSLSKKFQLSKEDVDDVLPLVYLKNRGNNDYREICRQNTFTADCDANSRYRRLDGQCNNLQHPTWGSAMTCQQRLLPANYAENSEFRTSINGEPLPEPRTLSLNLHEHLNRPTNYMTHMYMFFGQLLDHDLAQTPQSTTVENQAINCCPPSNETHPQCRPIIIQPDDPFYSQFNVTCINFVRSVLCPTCNLGQKEIMDLPTSTIDASFVYGNSENESRSLRTNDGTGRLRTQRSRYGDLLPASPDPENDQCSFPETNEICFQAGDPRVNQHTVLTSLHTIFMREHNRIAVQLRRINPRWSGERIFQEARRILGALMQNIVYTEYLPITLGNDMMSFYDLQPGWWTRYKPDHNPTTLVEFTTAAFRFGHSLINSVVTNTPLNATNGPRLLRNEFFQPFDLYRGLAGPLVMGASRSSAQMFDRHLVPDVTNFLYRIRGDQTGLDLASINIYRGRDHGVPTYVETVYYCSDKKINVTIFPELVTKRLMGEKQAKALQRNYRFVQDVDLWSGILMETPNDGAVVGPTAACIIAQQFHKLKFGDRFYFEHIYESGSFTYFQLQELRRMTLSQIICLNTEAQWLASNVMLFPDEDNPYIDCRFVTGVNLLFWKDWSIIE